MAKKSGGNGAAAQHPPDAAYFLSLTLQNIRCFGDSATLDLSDGQGRPARWTVLLGNNGTGKTTILQALACLEGLPTGSQAVHSDTLPSSEKDGPLLRGVHRRVGTTFVSNRKDTGQIDATIAQGRRLSHPDHSSQCLELSWYLQRGGIPSWQMVFQSQLIGPSCYGYGASRRASSASLAMPEDDDPTASLFSDDAHLRNAVEWLLRLDYAASKASDTQEREKQRLEFVTRLLLEILPEVHDIRFATRPSIDVEFETPYGWVSLRQLGHGYRTLITWMVDLASRLVDRFPDSPDPLAGPAVVLVDEIDLHLHPLWQRQLMGYLTKCFPNAQFIVTAHSPLVVQAAADDANIVLLRREGDRVAIRNDMDTIRGWRIDQLLTSDLFGLPSARPPQFDSMLARRKELLTKGRLTALERQELKQLEESIGPLPVGETAEDARATSLIDETIKLLQRQQDSRE